MKPLFSPHPLRLRARGAVPAILLACLAGLASMAPARAQTAAPDEPDPKAILMRMADYVAKLPAFSVDVRDSYDTMQESGQKIEFAETRKITVAWPDRMRLEVVESDGDRQTLVIDAKNITLTSEPENVYAQTPSPGNLDQAVIHSATVISVSGVTYYRCDTRYYTRSYSGGTVMYVQTAAPAGY